MPIRQFHIDRLYVPIALTISALLIPVPFASTQYRVFFIVVISCIYLPTVTLLKATWAHSSSRLKKDPYIIFGLGYTAIFSAMAIGTYTGMLPRTASGDNAFMYTIAIVLIAVYLLSIPLALGRKKKTAEEPMIITVNNECFEESCDYIARKNGISKSELNVMILLAKNMTYAGIASHLNISENTVRTHSRSIYRKLDIHSKQELTELVVAKMNK